MHTPGLLHPLPLRGLSRTGTGGRRTCPHQPGRHPGLSRCADQSCIAVVVLLTPYLLLNRRVSARSLLSRCQRKSLRSSCGRSSRPAETSNTSIFCERSRARAQVPPARGPLSILNAADLYPFWVASNPVTVTAPTACQLQISEALVLGLQAGSKVGQSCFSLT